MVIRLCVGLSILSMLTACGGGGSSSKSASSSSGAQVSTSTPTPDLKSDQWYLENSGTAPSSWGSYKTLTQGADMRVTGAWNAGAKGNGIVVTVVDDGVDFAHPDLKSQELAGYSMSYDTNNPNSAKPAESTSSDMHDHGTSIAGVIAAKDDNSGVVGIAPAAKLIGHRVLGLLDPTNTADLSLVRILANNVSQVSNHSYGPADNGQLHPQANVEYNQIESLVKQGNQGKGHVMVYASGNGGAYVPKDYR